MNGNDRNGTIEDSRQDTAEADTPDRDAGSEPRSSRKRWTPEADAETAAALRLLAARPWLIVDRDDAAIAAIRRNLAAVRDALSRLGWVLVVERDLIRLRKSPPVRRNAWAAGGPTSLQACWFFLLVAGAESVGPRVGLAQLVTAARAAAAEASLPITNDIAERRAIVRALRLLHDRGIVEQLDGNVDGFIDDENAPVLLAVHHTRLAHVIANYGTVDPAEHPEAWLEQVEREPDPARRMRRRLVDDTLVHAADLDEAEADWLSRRVRGDDGAPLAMAFGLHLERRAEGAAFVVPDDTFRHPRELGPTPFPSSGTVPHAALLLCEHAADSGVFAADAEGPAPGWRGLREADVMDYIVRASEALPEGRGWRRELAEDPKRLADQVCQLLVGLDLLRLRDAEDGTKTWWFSPATGRWAFSSPGAKTAKARSNNKKKDHKRPPGDTTGKTLAFDFGPAGPRSSK